MINLLKYTLNASFPELPVSRQTVINTLNAYSCCVAKQDALFMSALEQSDVLLPDGFGIVLASKILLGRKISRLAGWDIHLHLLRQAQQQGLKVFYMGAGENTLQKIQKRLSLEYPAVSSTTYPPPYRESFSENENRKIIEAINGFEPDILFVGMTAPKQEKWVHQHKARLNARVICSIGAVFDFYAGTVKRAPVWMQKAGLEWFHRAVLYPNRLGRRYLTSHPKFILEVIRKKITAGFK